MATLTATHDFAGQTWSIVLRSCFVGNFELLFDELMANDEKKPAAGLLAEAETSHNPYFK